MRGRVAVGAGLVAAVLTVGGPCVTAAHADPGHGGNHGNQGGQGGNRGDGDRHGNGGPRRSDSFGDSRRESRNDFRHGDDGHDGRGDRRDDDDRPRYSYGSDRPEAEWTEDGDSTAPSLSTSDTSATVGSTSRIAVADVAEQPAVPVPAVPVPAAPPASPAPVADGGASPAAGGTPAPIVPPTVVVGDGRAPGLLSGTSDPAPPVARITDQSTAASLPPAAAVPAPPVVLPATPPTSIPGVGAREPLPWFTSQMWAPVEPRLGGGALFGLAGLVLLPLAGVWLGYRQALASRAASQLVHD